jgi:putative hydrolase of the HAD superfamily
MIRAIFFDFDGVLTTDSSGSYTTCKNLKKVSNAPLNKLIACYRKYSRDLNLGATHDKIWEVFCNCLGEKLDISCLREAFLSTPKNEEMLNLVEEVRKICKVGIITDNNKERFDLIREAWRLDEFFDSLIMSAGVGSMKDTRAIFEKALDSLNVRPEECVFIDNQEKNLSIPKGMGFKTIFYKHEENDVGALKYRLKTLGVGL